MVERFHRQLKDSLRCLNNDPKWTSQLPLVLLSIRSSVKEDLKHSSAELVFGTPLKLPADIVETRQDAQPDDVLDFASNLKAIVDARKPTPTRVEPSETVIPENLMTCEHVLVRVDKQRKPLERPYRGPYEVVARNKHTFTIKTPSGNENVNITRLKPAKIDKKTVTYNLPRKRGRPPKNPKKSG